MSQPASKSAGVPSAAFAFTRQPIDATSLRAALADPAAGGFASFEGWVRNHNEGLPVRHLEYEAFEALAIKEGERVVAESIARFGIEHAACVHRIGELGIGEMAVWVGVSARHRHEAFLACRYIIDEIKHRLPIWKKEHYEDGDSGWVNCERCAAQPQVGPTDHPGPPGLVSDVDAAHGITRGPPHSHAAAPDYSRQIALPEVGHEGQAKLLASRVLVVGCGGLGAPVISYLAGAGVGNLGLVDGDRLEASNLHRQTLFALADVGRFKAGLAAERVRALNPQVQTHVYPLRLDAENARELLSRYDLVIDCSDNFATKFLLNDFCVLLSKPAVFASVYQYEGQLQIVRPDRNGACLRCVWPEATRDGIVGNCAQAGVLGPVPGLFGSLQAFEALKLLLDLPAAGADELLMLDLMTFSVSRIRARRAQNCPEHARSRALAAEDSANGVAGAAGAKDEAQPEIEFESLGQAQAAGFEIVDIRESEEAARLPASIDRLRHIPMSQLLHGQPAFAPQGRSLLICASGRRSLAAAQELRARGITEVYSLRGGIAALQSASRLRA